MISFIVVSYNSKRTLRDCLTAATTQPNSEVIVVDNASSDDSSAISKSFDGVTFVQSDTNLGFNGGNALGVAEATGDIIVLLNPDSVLDPDYSIRITELFATMPEVGIIGCRMLNGDDSLQSTGSMFPTMRSWLYEHSGYHRLFPHSRAYNRYTISDWDRSTSRRVDAVAGSCMAMRRVDLDRVGGLDTHYFLFYEEVDLSRAMLAIGKHAYYAADIEVHHIGGNSTKQVANATIDGFYHDSRAYYMKKYHGQAYVTLYHALAWICNGAARVLSVLQRLAKLTSRSSR